MSSLGQLVVSIAANTAQFTSDMGKAAYTAQKTADQMSRAFGNVKNLLGTLGVGLSIGGLVSIVKSSIDAADKLNDLSKSANIAVTTLSGLQLAAKQSGSDLDSIAQAVNKLSVNIGKNAEKFASIGVTAKDPLEAFKQLADVFVAIEDPQQRAAFAAEALGKSWQGTAPLLAEGSKRIGEMVERGMALSGITEDLVKNADEFNDGLEEMKTVVGGILANELKQLLPSLIEVAKYINDSGAAAKSTASDFSLLNTIFQTVAVLSANVAFVFKGVGIELGGIAAQLGTLATGDFKAFSAIGSMMKEDAALARKNLDEFEAKIMGTATKAAKVSEAVSGSKKGRPNLSGFLPEASKTAGQSFIENLKSQIVKIGEGEFAMLRLEASQKKVSAAAEPYIKQLERVKAAHQLLVEQQQIQLDLEAKLFSKEAKDLFDDPASIDDFIRGLKEENAEREFQVSLIGKTAEEQERLTAARKVDLAVQQQIRSLSGGGSVLSDENIEDLKKRAEEQKKITDQIFMDRKEKESDWLQGSKDGMAEYLDSVRNMYANSKRAAVNAFRSMEDALVKFVTTGKLDFKSLAESILADIVRIQARAAITQIFGGGSGGGSGGIFDGILNLFGGGGEDAGMAAFSSMDFGDISAFSTAFANGGVMSSRGRVPLRKYAGGGVANSPQMAVFGEGSMNEAFVPLPDGNRIPVELTGNTGGGSVTVNYIIDARGAQPGVGEEVRRAIRQSEERSVERAVQTVMDRQQRGAMRFA